ncbi:MAG: hypothetical protein IPO71_13235 [Nitrosomonas sp.]|nr:hypothetical protein [Nitrosomonas sp.]
MQTEIDAERKSEPMGDDHFDDIVVEQVRIIGLGAERPERHCCYHQTGDRNSNLGVFIRFYPCSSY